MFSLVYRHNFLQGVNNMRKKVLKMIVFVLCILHCSVLFFSNSVRAEDVKTASQIRITQNPTKLTYASGEEFDTTGMIVECTYTDGTIANITDYQVTNFNKDQIGPQNVTLQYQSCSANLSITVNPVKVSNVKVSSHTTTSLALTWDSIPNTSYYEIYSQDATTGSYNLESTVYGNSTTFQYAPATLHSYQIRAVAEVNGTKYTGEYSKVINAATNPEQVKNLVVLSTSESSVGLSWDALAGATGYNIYRYNSSTKKYDKCGTTVNTTYVDYQVSSGKGYTYRIKAYTYSKTFLGVYSDKVMTSTNPAMVVLKCKAGDGKIRVAWSNITGATSYDIYMDDGTSGYNLISTNQGNSNCKYIAQGLTPGNTYSFYAIAHRIYNGVTYDSTQSAEESISVLEVEPTNTNARYFSTKKAFTSSAAYTKIPFFKKNVNYSKSFIVPGLINTKSDGFPCTSMCPQGITFAGDYLLISAYDRSFEENSVIYALDKNTKQLLTTFTVPGKSHLGGITFDGSNVWITLHKGAASISFAQMDSIIKQGITEANLTLNTTVNLDIVASYITYYNDKLWIGTYDELKDTIMKSYTIINKDTAPDLTEVDSITVPTRVQGLVFTDSGQLILSRSCQLYKGLRGYMRQLDVYEPDMSTEGSGTIDLGDSINTLEMPSMNEGIAIDNSDLYVIYESASFSEASYRMDRVCAFSLSSITNTKK